MRDRLPLVLFVASLALLAALAGLLAGIFRWPPYPAVANGVKTAQVIVDRLDAKDRGTFKRFASFKPADAPAHRVEPRNGAGLAEPVLFYGGRFQFSDLCGEEGCLAVEFGRDRQPVRAYPYRAQEIFAANVTDDYPYEAPLFSFARDARPTSVQRFGNGDLLVVFQNRDTYPYGGGVGRVGPDGHPRWFRWDYSHHWATRVDDERLLVPGFELGSAPIEVNIGKDRRVKVCESGRPLLDTINVLDGNGRLTAQIRLVEKLLESPYRAILQHTSDACDPIHLNYIDVLDDSAAGIAGLQSGDLVASLRNLSAFVVLDASDGTLKRLVSGTFFQQHAVSHLEGSRFLLFDNHGADDEHGPSRLLMVDVATGQETTVFPNDATPPELGQLFSGEAGKIDISADRQRAIAVFSAEGTAVEVRLADGAVLSVFRAVSDVSHVAELDEDKRRSQAGIFWLYGVDYLDSP